jgi:adenylate kinase family enzyme
MRRIAIIGSPRGGKTTLALELAADLGVQVRHSDDLIGEFDWSAASEHIASTWLAEPGPWIIEGVAVVRALRKWLESHPAGLPCDKIIVLDAPRVPLTIRQAGMGKSCATILEGIRGPLLARGVVFEGAPK